MSARPWYPVSREFWQHPDWCKRSAHERLAWLYLLSVTRWRDGDGILRGQARTSMAEIGREVGKPAARAKDWMDRWVKIGAVTYEVTADDAKRATGIVVTVLGYERWAANAKAYAGDVDGHGVSGEVPNDEAYADRAPYAEAYAGENAKAYADANAGKRDDIGVSGEAANANPYAEANAAPNAGPYASYIGHDLGHGRGGETRAGARDPNPSLPGLESPEGDDRRPVHDGRERRDESPTSPAATSASHTAAGVGPGAVERRWGAVMPGSAEFSRLVGEAWAELYRAKHPGKNPFEGNGASAKRRLMTEVMHPLSLETTPDDALATFRAVAARYLAMGGGKAKAHHPLWFLVEDWHDIAAAPDAPAVDPADPHGWASFVPDEFDEAQDRIFDEMMRMQREGSDAR